jgi:hypothetical protein
MTPRIASRLARLAAGAALAASATLGSATAGWAAVTVDQESAVRGETATVVFNVRTDRPTVSTTGLDITFPADHALTDVLTQPKPGWEITVEKGTSTSAPTPSASASASASSASPASSTSPASPEGAAGERVTRIRWTAPAGPAAIGPYQFDLFSISVGPIPAGLDKVVFSAVQTYSDGPTVAWSEQGATGEGARPAPVLMLNAAPAAPAAPAVPAPAVPAAPAAPAAPAPEATPVAADLPAAELASAGEATATREDRVTLGLSVGVGLILLSSAVAATARRRGGSTPAG